MPNDPWERIADLAEQIEKFARNKTGFSPIYNMAMEIIMQLKIIAETEEGYV